MKIQDFKLSEYLPLQNLINEFTIGLEKKTIIMNTKKGEQDFHLAPPPHFWDD